MIVTIGYLASVFLALSLLVKSNLQFRWLNMLGCLTFIVYGALINAMPIILTNVLLFLINIFYLVRIYNTKEAFEIVEFDPSEKVIAKFLDYHHNDLQTYFPHFSLAGTDHDFRFLVLRDMNIANIFVVSIQPGGTAHVKINYTVPKYRDYKVGSYIFEKEKKYLLSKGISKVAYQTVHNKSHESFLKKMGFRWTQSQASPVMVKEL